MINSEDEYTFKKERTVFFHGAVDEKSYSKLITDISSVAQNEEFVDLHITSGGGSCIAGFGIISTIWYALKPTNLRTFILGDASSMAILLGVMGKVRYISPYSLCLFHQFYWETATPAKMTTREMHGQGVNMLQGEELYAKIIAEGTDGMLSKEMVTDLMLQNRTLSAVEAVQYGLAHHILQR
jgi:ATP-dependent protease ClpP protease subunit